MRRAAKVDANQKAIVACLRDLHCTVEHLHSVGGGVPDLLIGFRGKNYLAEIKDGSLSPSRRKLNPEQVVWHEVWRGQVMVLETVDDARDWIINLCRKAA